MKRSAVTIGIALVVLSPLARPQYWTAAGFDDFPISSYPMFSRGDIAGRHVLSHALVVHADGHRSPATPSQVGSPEPMVATAIVGRAIQSGAGGELCALIASNVTDADAVSVEVAMSEYDPTTYFRDGKREPESRVVYASCPVKPR